MKTRLLLITLIGMLGFVGNSLASHDDSMHPMPTVSEVSSECKSYIDIKKNNSLILQDIVVKTFVAKYHESKLVSKESTVDSNGLKTDFFYRYTDGDASVIFGIYFRDIGKEPFECFVPVYYNYKHVDNDETLGVDFYYNHQKIAINIIANLAMSSPYSQLSEGVPIDDVACRLGLQKIIKHDGSPACVNYKTKNGLIQRGWAKGDTSHVGKMLEELKNNPDKITLDQSEYIRQIVSFDPRVQELLDGREFYFRCCSPVSVNNTSQNQSVSITLDIVDSADQIVVGLDLETLRVSIIFAGFGR